MKLVKTKKSFRFLLLGSITVLLLLLLTFFFFAGRIISSPKVKQKIQQTLFEQTGVEADWLTVGVSKFPYPAIILQKVSLNLPDRFQGNVEELRITPEIMPLLTGDIRLTRIVLEKPVIDLDLSESDTVKASAGTKSQGKLEDNLNTSILQLGQFVPDLDLIIRDGRLSVTHGRKNRVKIKEMDLQFGVTMDDSSYFLGDVQGKVSQLEVFHGGQEETIRNAEIKGSVSMKGSIINVALKQLVFTEPGVELSGNLAMDSHTPDITLNLTGKDIDVDATRRVALALAGGISPVKVIFDYLRGGTIPLITFQSEGETPVQLGSLNNISINGKLVKGAVSVQAIDLDLTDVIADVKTAAGIKVHVDEASLLWKHLNWSPVKGSIDFIDDKTQIKVTEAKLCGIDSPGDLTIADNNLAFDFTLDGNGLDVAHSAICLTQGKSKITGTLDVSSHISGQGQAEELTSKMQGPLNMALTNGVIEQNSLLTSILEVLNVTEVVKGRLPDLNRSGFAYSTITVQGQFQDGKLLVKEIYMDGETLDILGQGEIVMEEGTLDFKLLAAPFQTVDTVVKNIPVVKHLLGSNLVTIPILINGKLDDPNVQVMAAASVPTSLLKLGEQTLRTPGKMLETLMPEKTTE